MITSAEYFEPEVQLAEIAGILNAQHARLVGVAARALRGGNWCGEGIQSFTHWLTIRLGVCSGQAKKIATIAARVDEFPLLITAFIAANSRWIRYGWSAREHRGGPTRG